MGETPKRRCADCGEPVIDIIAVLDHASACERVLRAEDLTRGEQDTLLYVESRLMDHGGELDLEQMNYHDQQNLKLFGAAGLLDVDERHPAVDHGGMQVTKFIDEAWDLARDCRQLRAARNVDGDVNVGELPRTEAMVDGE